MSLLLVGCMVQGLGAESNIKSIANTGFVHVCLIFFNVLSLINVKIHKNLAVLQANSNYHHLPLLRIIMLCM